MYGWKDQVSLNDLSLISLILRKATDIPIFLYVLNIFLYSAGLGRLPVEEIISILVSRTLHHRGPLSVNLRPIKGYFIHEQVLKTIALWGMGAKKPVKIFLPGKEVLHL